MILRNQTAFKLVFGQANARIIGEYPLVVSVACFIVVDGQRKLVLAVLTTRLVAGKLDSRVTEIATDVILGQTILHGYFSRNDSDEFEFSTKGDALASSGRVVDVVRHDLLRIDGIDDNRLNFLLSKIPRFASYMAKAPFICQYTGLEIKFKALYFREQGGLEA